MIVLLLACAPERREPPPAAAPAPAPAPAPAAAITTDRDRYVLREGPYGAEGRIVTTFRAPEDRDVHLLHCNGGLSVGVQQQVGNGWRNAWIAEVNGCFSPPIHVPAGTTHRTEMRVISRAETGMRLTDGIYRAVWFGVVTSFDPRDPAKTVDLPLEERVSKPFFIDVP